MRFASLHKKKKKTEVGQWGRKEHRFAVNGSGLERSHPLKSPGRSVLLLLPASHESLDYNTESSRAEVAGPSVSLCRVLCGAVRGERQRRREDAVLLRADLC